jgi:hypothetical protein
MLNKPSANVKSPQIPDLEWHPFAEKFPLLEGAEWEAFKASIKATGGNEQRITYRLANGRKEGLDGRNRYRACQELGIEPLMEMVFLNDAEVKEYITRRNIYRRHLTPEQRRGIVADLRSERKTTREIAEIVGVNQSTVARDLATSVDANASTENENSTSCNGDSVDAFASTENENHSHENGKACGGNSPPKKVTGRDGKKYKARKQRKPKKPTMEREPGDGTAPEETPPRRNPDEPKNGHEAFDWRQFHDDYTRVQKAIDRFGTAYDCRAEADALGERLDGLRREFKELFERVSGTTAPGAMR